MHQDSRDYAKSVPKDDFRAMDATQRSHLGLLLDQKHTPYVRAIRLESQIYLVPGCIYKSAASLRIDDLNDDTGCLLVWRTMKSNIDPKYQ